MSDIGLLTYGLDSNSRMLETNLNIGFYVKLDLPLRLDLIKFYVYRYFNVNLFVVWCVIMVDLIKLLLL